MAKRIRVLIVDDHPVVRFGVTHMLKAEPDLHVVGEAADVHEAARKIAALSPDVTVLDMEMGDAHGVETLRSVRAVAPAARVVVYTAFDDGDRVAEAVGLGVQGYLLKDSSNQELARAIRVVNEGGTVLDPGMATKLVDRMNNGHRARESLTLSGRQTEILRLLSEGKNNRDIAEQLYISERTVKFHVSSILSKLHASNRTQAVLIASQRGLVELPSAART